MSIASVGESKQVGGVIPVQLGLVIRVIFETTLKNANAESPSLMLKFLIISNKCVIETDESLIIKTTVLKVDS